MQQTETYKLNLIESSDPFLPDALNENTRKIEEVVHEKLGEMDQRVTVLEAKKFAVGTYKAEMNETLKVEVGFTPIALYVGQSRKFSTIHGLILPGDTNIPPFLEIVEGGFTTNIMDGHTAYPGIYHYIAFG
jgi:hypothetical protein